MFTLDEIEEKYRIAVDAAIEGEKSLNASSLIELSVKLYEDLKVEGVADDSFGDVLLFQYGVSNWGDEYGLHYDLDVTRQFMMEYEDEPYQLSFTLVYDPEPFGDVGSCNCWSADFADIESFVSHIESTKGFTEAKKHKPKAHIIRFDQC